MALGTFLDIEGFFDNVAFHAIEKILHKKSSSFNDNKCIINNVNDKRSFSYYVIIFGIFTPPPP